MPPHKKFATWAGAVKEWNRHQAFKDELYGIPRKGGEFYDEVYELFYGKPAEAEPKPEPKPEPNIPISDLVEYHNALAGRRPRAAIAYYENKYPHLKKNDVKVEAKVAENVPEEDLNVAFDKDLTVDFSKFTTLEDKVKKIREVLFAGHFTRADKKAALIIALDILKYKENHIIQEARKPIQKEIVIMLNDIRKTPIFKKYNIVGHNPASGIPDYRIIDNSDLVNDIPTINADLLEEIEKDQKANEKARKKADKEREKRDMIEEQERKERDKKLNALVDVEAVKKRWGKYPDELIAYLHKNKIEDSLDFAREINKLPSDVPRRPQAVWKNFFVDLAESA